MGWDAGVEGWDIVRVMERVGVLKELLGTMGEMLRVA